MNIFLNNVIRISLVITFISASIIIASCGNSAQDFLHQGNLYSSQERWDEAVAEYGKAIEKDPNLVMAYFNRGKAYYEQRKYDLAVYDLNTVLVLSTDINIVQEAVQIIEGMEGMALERVVGNTQSAVSEIRGLAPKEEVNYQFITTDDMRIKISEIFKEKYPDEKIANEKDFLILLRLLDEDQDLHQMVEELYLGQVAGLYESYNNELFVNGNATIWGSEGRIALAHEISLALQDQYFDLNRLISNAGNNSDMAMAATALMEGDASLVHTTYMENELDRNDIIDSILDIKGVDKEKFKISPQFLQDEALFSYIEGMNFINAIGGREKLNQAYENPPKSTEQILHPDKYLEREDPRAVYYPDISCGQYGLKELDETWTQLDTNVMGEFFTRTFLDTFIDNSEAEKAAEGWGGDRYIYLKNAEGEEVLVLTWVWDTKKDAEEFFNAAEEAIEKSHKGSLNLFEEEVDNPHRAWSTPEGMIITLSYYRNYVVITYTPSDDVRTQVGFRLYDWSPEQYYGPGG